VSRTALLDVNVLVALFDPDHVHHDPAHDWFADHRASGWATCPLTENGLVRILSNPAYTPAAEPPSAIVRRLRSFCESGHHVFWPEDVSLRDEEGFAARMPVTSRQVTDAYLLALARRRGGCLVTFDQAIPVAAVRDASPADLVVIGAQAP
jgi:toxin-antitoxin system PIN domain toxin